MVKSTVNILLLLILLMTVSSCKNTNNMKMLKATRKLEVYKTYENDQQQVIYYLNPGEQCSLGRKEIAKLYGYYEVDCPEKGHGWVIMGDGYEIIDKK